MTYNNFANELRIMFSVRLAVKNNQSTVFTSTSVYNERTTN